MPTPSLTTHTARRLNAIPNDAQRTANQCQPPPFPPKEIDVGEDEPRQIASGLRPHFSLEQMEGQRLLVVANLKPKKLVGFKARRGATRRDATSRDTPHS